jgi:hypothetical protein
MPQIPSYGYDETTEGELNSAKRRVIGYMDSTHQRLTEYPEKDPTNGRATVELANLTDNVYLAIKSIDILDSYIRTDTTIIDMLDKPQQASEIKKTAKELISVNNTLRKINASYNKLRPNITYVELSVWTDFTSSVDLLRRASYKFYSFMDKLIREEKKVRGEDYDPPPVFDGGDDDAGDEGSPPITEPIDELAPDETLLPPLEPLIPSATNSSSSELPVMQPTPPSSSITFIPEPPSEPSGRPRPPRPTRPSSGEPIMQPTPPTSGLAPPPITGLVPTPPALAFQDSNVARRKYKTRVRKLAKDAGLPIEERDDIVQDAEAFEQREGRFANDDEIRVLIDTHINQTGPRPPTAETLGMDIMIPQDTEALIAEVSRTVAQLTNQTMITELNRRVKAIEEEGRVGSVKKSNIQNLRKALAIARHPVVTVNKRDIDKIPEDIKADYKTLDRTYRNSRDKLEPNMHYGKRAKFVDFLKANNIPYFESSVLGRIQAFETPMAAPFPAPPPPAGKRPVLPPIGKI